MYSYIFRPKAEKEFKKLPRIIQTHIRDKLKFFLSTSNPLNFATYMKDSELGTCRFRVGDYRIIFDIEDETLVILSVGHRREIYK